MRSTTGPVRWSGGDCLVTLVGRRQIACAELDLSELRWSRSTEEEWSTFNPLVLGDLVIVGSASDELFAFSLSDGSTAWELPLEGALRGLGAKGKMLYVGTIGGTVYALEIPSLHLPGSESRSR